MWKEEGDDLGWRKNLEVVEYPGDQRCMDMNARENLKTQHPWPVTPATGDCKQQKLTQISA